ncbi:HD-hydrolase domain [hydrothermal vent metagenome]|uniref:HD-hydrolase domain n=1 Tax=hydrothermal vent metagenome TaxID=652676 RepID=A0A3B1AZK0_9ZZZZ
MDNSYINVEDQPYRVLIVDDDPVHRIMEREILSTSDYMLQEAANSEEALEILKREDFDVVLLDKCMPDMDGDQLCREIRGQLQLSLLPIIMVTGYNQCEEMMISMLAGANDFINKPYNPSELIMRVNAAAHKKRLTDQLDNTEALLFTIARMVEAKDSNTGDHCSRLAHSAVIFGKKLGLSNEDLINLRRGAVLHDIGKMGVPDSILLKKSALTKDEWHIMHQHTLIGEYMCKELKTLQKTIPIIRSHHERWNGTGYPDGVEGEGIPFLARVFQIVDIHDALAHNRPYKKALAVKDIIQIFEQEMEYGWRDPVLIPVFLDILYNDADSLVLPREHQAGSGKNAFDSIRQTGIYHK